MSASVYQVGAYNRIYRVEPGSSRCVGQAKTRVDRDSIAVELQALQAEVERLKPFEPQILDCHIGEGHVGARIAMGTNCLSPNCENCNEWSSQRCVCYTCDLHSDCPSDWTSRKNESCSQFKGCKKAQEPVKVTLGISACKGCRYDTFPAIPSECFKCVRNGSIKDHYVEKDQEPEKEG